jgi:glutamine amidotransferase
MCRHLAYLGPSATLRSVLVDPPHGLYRQAWAPRLMRHGTVNADGFGVGWYAAGDPAPARYRRTGPIWADESLPDIARVIRSTAVLAAVRNATEGMAGGERAAAPFASGPWLFSHNGVLEGWPASAAAIADAVGAGAATLLSLEARVDSAFLWALIRVRLAAGRPMTAALAETIAAVEAAGGTGRFNFLLADGESIAATACGDTLWYRRADGGVVVASEPGDDGPGWAEVPDRHVLTATPTLVSVRPLEASTPAARSRPVPAGRPAARVNVTGPKPAHRSLNSPNSPNAPNAPNAPTTTSATKGTVTG